MNTAHSICVATTPYWAAARDAALQHDGIAITVVRVEPDDMGSSNAA